MRNTLKAATLESKFPLLAVESDCIVSKDADITVAFEVELPELFTVTSAEYAAIHAAWCKAIKVLPDYTVVHKQDWFVKERYHGRTEGERLGFLSRSYELHFNERPFLNHRCYLYLTKTTKERMRMQSSFSSLCRGFIIPKEVNRDAAARFLDAAGQFARIVNDTGLVRLRRLPGDEGYLEDIEMMARNMLIYYPFKRIVVISFRFSTLYPTFAKYINSNDYGS